MITIPPESYIRDVYNPYKANIIIGKYTSIAEKLKVIIASHPSITDNTVSNYPFREKVRLDYPRCHTGGTITIGNDVWIGENVTLYGRINIGDGAIVGGSAVVAKDVQPYSIVVGNPIRLLRYRFTGEQIEKLLKIKWWDWPTEKIYNAVVYMRDINNFIKRYE